MARTLIGSLILRLKQEGAAETKRSVTDALSGIEGAARRMNTGNWGAKFDEALRRLKVTPTEHAAIVASWGRLQTAIDGKMTGPQKSAWRTGVLGHLATIRAEVDSTNARAKVLGGTLRSLGNFAMIGLGGLGAYGAYNLGRGGVTAAFEQQRVEAAGYFSGLSEDDQVALKAAAEELSAKYGLFVGNMLTVLQEASMSMPSTEAALGSGDAMARLLTSLEAVYGPEGAVSQLYAFNKAADNAEFNLTPEEYYTAADNFIRAQRVLGKDFSAESFRQAIQYSRIAGKALDDHFLQTWLPVLASETSGSDAGTQTRALFDQLIGGRAPVRAKNQMTEWGVMDEEGNLARQDVYEQNQTMWAHDVLLPLLREAGVNVENEVDLARALAAMTNNRLASDNLARSIMQFEQYLRTAETLIPKAKGLEAAEEVRERDPFAAVQGFVNSLSNLSGALGEHVAPIIVPAFESLSGAVEGIAAAVRGAEGWEVGLGAVAAVAGGLGALTIGKVGLSWITAGPSLQTAAIMLQGAATSLGGAPGATGNAGAGQNAKGGWTAALAFLNWATIGAVALDTAVNAAGLHDPVHETTGPQGAINLSERLQAKVMEMFAGAAPATDAPPLEATGAIPGLAGMVAPQALANMGVDTTQVEQAGAAADTTKSKLEALNTTLKPLVDLTNISQLVRLLQVAIQLQSKLGAMQVSGTGNVRDQINAMYANFGVAP